MYSYDSRIDKIGRDRSPAQGSDLECARIGVSLTVITAGTICIWVLSNTPTSTAGTLASWAAALALVVTALVAFAYKGGSAGWFHPLSLPFASIAVMCLGAPLWVYFTHESVGLLYDSGYESINTSTLAVALSVTTCKALTLVLIGYMIGTGAALALTREDRIVVADQERPIFRYQGMRRVGLTLMAAAAVAQLVVTALGRGTPYGANQLQYGLPAILGPIATTSLMAGLITVTLAASHTAKPTRLRNLLSGPEWAALILYFLGVILAGERGQLIAPVVYLAWLYGTRVRVIPIKWIVAGLLLVLIGGTMISNYRQNQSLWQGSPTVLMQNAMGDVSSSAWLTQQTVIHVPSMEGFMYGSTYLAAVEGQLPGPLSRATGAPTRTASAVFRNIVDFSDPNEGFAESYPSEAYLNFGLFGCLGAGLFLGMLLGWAWRKRRDTATRPRNVLYPVLLAGLIYGFRSDALTQIKDVLYPMLMVAALMGWYRLRVSRDLATMVTGNRHQSSVSRGRR
jgi:hypothetical protein